MSLDRIRLASLHDKVISAEEALLLLKMAWLWGWVALLVLVKQSCTFSIG
jgi:hypothetical protein